MSFARMPMQNNMATKDTKNLNNNLKKLEEISDWFDNRGEVDVEEGLEKVKEAVVLIKESKERLKQIENEFEEIKKDVTSANDEK
jgi:exonuclease VII small subunit